MNYWPVWKNIYSDFHLVRNANVLPVEERALTEDEQTQHDYRAACKRCYLYILKNVHVEEVLEPELADYYKGEAFIILEELTLSLLEIPKISEYQLKGADYVFNKAKIGSQALWDKVEQHLPDTDALPVAKKSIMQVIVTDNY